jgi:hypothetical protein
MALEILHCPVVFFGSSQRRKCTQILSLASLCVFLAGIQAALKLQFANHAERMRRSGQGVGAIKPGREVSRARAAEDVSTVLLCDFSV